MKEEEASHIDTLPLSQFHLPRKMSKLRTFKNDMIDIVQHADLWRDIDSMPALPVADK